ncbi:MAG: MoaD/ThiS family protein [Rhodoglobus sp.]|nr:MoaD/ThiS family protein [Rhodoglobus sp.]
MAEDLDKLDHRGGLDHRDSIAVRYFAAAADAAGREEESLPPLGTVRELKSVLVERYGDAMARVLASGSFLVDGVVSRDDGRALGSRVDVLPPFAGG